MKLFALLVLTGFALATPNSEWLWKTGNTYRFDYSGRLLTGLPQLASHYSGIAISATVAVDAVSPTKIQLSLETPRYANVDGILENRLSGIDGANWREVKLPALKEVDPELKVILEQPIIVEFINGEIKEAQISKNEPEWSVNLKKGLALLFQAKVDVATWLNEEAMNQVHSSPTNNFWKTKEQAIDGICEVTYQVNELPKYMVRDRPELVPHPEECAEDKYFEVIKTKNVDNCDKRASFSFEQPGHIECTGPNCKEMWARTSETRFIACGSRGKMVLQSIINQGELNAQLFGMKTERVVTGTLQTLRLVEVKTQAPKPLPQALTPLRTMMYEYSFNAYQSVQQQIEQEEQSLRIPRAVSKQPEELAKAIPALGLSAHKQVPKPKIIEEIKTILKSVLKDLERPIEAKAYEKQIAMQVVSVARGLSVLKRAEILALYKEVEPLLTTETNLFIDAVIMAGTPESIMFLKEFIESGSLCKEHIIQMLYVLPNTLIIPTEEVLDQLFLLIKSPRIQECPISKNVAHMAMSTILKKACMCKERDMKYPSWVFGKFCEPQSPIVVSKWIPHLVEDLETAPTFDKKNEAIVALGLLPHEEIIGKLIPYVEGRVQGVQEVPRLTRLLALWSLSTSGMVKPQAVEPLFYSIFANPAEATEMRIAAFNILVKLNPPVAIFQKIATRTWIERDMEVLKVVNSALFTLSNEYFTVTPKISPIVSLPKKASLVYPLIKKTKVMLPTSASIYTSEKLEQLGVGFEGMTNWIASSKSVIPIEMYSELNYVISRFNLRAFAIGLRIEGAEELYHKIAELITPLEQGQTVPQQLQGMAKKVKDSLSSQWRKVIQELDLKSVKSGKINSAIFVELLETTPIFGNVVEMTTQKLKQSIVDLLKDPVALKEKLEKERVIDVKKALKLSQVMALIPTDMGLPLVVDVTMPMLVSVKGKAKVGLSWTKPLLDLKTEMFYSLQLFGTVGVVNPLNKEYVSTSIDQTLAATVPIATKVEMDLVQQSVKVSAKIHCQCSNPNEQKVKLLHYHVHPFTSRQVIGQLAPIALNPTKQIIRSRDTLKERSLIFGEYLGYHFHSLVRTESKYFDLVAILERLRMYKYNPMNMLRTVFSQYATDAEGRISVRRHEYSLMYDPIQSTTKEMKILLTFGYGSKTEEGGPLVYNQVKILSEVEQKKIVDDESQPILKALKKIVPVSYEVVPIPAVPTLENSRYRRHHDLGMNSGMPKKMVKIVEAVEPLDQTAQVIRAATLKWTTILEQKSGRPLTWSYFATIAAAQKEQAVERKLRADWNFIMESEQTHNKIVLKGNLVAPILPIWGIHEIRNSLIDFRWFQCLQLIQSGSKVMHVEVTGTTKVSPEQKEYSKVSQEARECAKMIEMKKSGSYHGLAELSEACEQQNLQARILDEIEFDIKYVVVPKTVEIIENYVVDVIKAYLWPFRQITTDITPRQPSINNAPVMVRIVFNKRTPSFDLLIQRPIDVIRFNKIRLPIVLDKILPLKAGINNVKHVAQQLTGKDLFPVCVIEQQTLRTFDNKTYPITLDACHRVLVADATEAQKWGIMVRQLPGAQKEIEIYIEESKIELTSAAIKLTVDGQEILPVLNKYKALVSPLSGKTIGKVVEAQVHGKKVILISTSLFAIVFDGHNIWVETSQLYKGKLSGVCGNANQQIRDELVGPDQCIHSTPEILSAAYRVKIPQNCDMVSPLPQPIKDQLRKEKTQCLKEQQIPTKVSKSLNTQNGQCTNLKHSVVRQPGKICISMKPVTQCAIGCLPETPQPLNKRIPFTCFNEDRLGEHYAIKAGRGEKLDELKGRQSHFEAEVPQPRSCVPASNYL